MKYLAMAVFEIDLNKFFDIFLLDNKEALFFFIEDFNWESRENPEIADKSDLVAIIKQIKATKPPVYRLFLFTTVCQVFTSSFKSFGYRAVVF